MNLNDLIPQNVTFIDEAYDDLLRLDGSIIKTVLKGIIKVAQNPRPNYEGGYGKPLGNKNGINLTGLNKIKFKKIGVRCVYQCTYDEVVGMKVIVISMRADNEVYDEAEVRIKSIENS